MTFREGYMLKDDEWINKTIIKLKHFETDILNAIKLKGWDGNEDTGKMQWTFMGALFYSIIVITTIGNFVLINERHLLDLLNYNFYCKYLSNIKVSFYI